MTAIQPRSAEACFKKPDAHFAVVLVYGPDTGLVHERARALVTASVEDLNDPFQLVRIDGDALSDDPSRLIEEVSTIPLFDGRRAVWVRAATRNLASAVEPILEQSPSDCRGVI